MCSVICHCFDNWLILSQFIQVRTNNKNTALVNFQKKKESCKNFILSSCFNGLNVNVLAITSNLYFPFWSSFSIPERVFLKINFWTMIKTKIQVGSLLTIIPDWQKDVSIMTQEVCLSVSPNLFKSLSGTEVCEDLYM